MPLHTHTGIEANCTHTHTPKHFALGVHCLLHLKCHRRKSKNLYIGKMRFHSNAKLWQIIPYLPKKRAVYNTVCVGEYGQSEENGARVREKQRVCVCEVSAEKKVHRTRPTTVTYNEMCSPMSAKHCTFACVLLTARIYDFDLLFYTLFARLFYYYIFGWMAKKGFVLGHISCVYECVFFCHSVLCLHTIFVYIDVNVALDQAPRCVYCQPVSQPASLDVCVCVLASFWFCHSDQRQAMALLLCLLLHTMMARIGVFRWIGSRARITAVVVGAANMRCSSRTTRSPTTFTNILYNLWILILLASLRADKLNL